MTLLVWHLEDHRASLDTGRLNAALDLACPAEGVVNLRVRGTTLPSMRLQGIALPSSPQGRGGLLSDEYVRGSDLVAAYRESTDWPVHVEVFRRATTLGQRTAAEALQMLVSVRTPELHTRPELEVVTRLPADAILRLADPQQGRFCEAQLDPNGSCSLRRGDGAGCLLFRLPQSELSYVEMVHPAEFCGSQLAAPTQSGGPFTLRHGLFACPLEKGVILRARVCGVFVPRSSDERAATACYSAFVAAPLPLGT